MAYVLQQFTVADFRTFKHVFLDDLERRRRLGPRGARVFHSVGSENEVTVLIEYDSTANAEQFSDSLELREAVKWATGDVVPQKISVLEKVLDAEA
jgi:hypothetical protein